MLEPFFRVLVVGISRVSFSWPRPITDDGSANPALNLIFSLFLILSLLSPSSLLSLTPRYPLLSPSGSAARHDRLDPVWCNYYVYPFNGYCDASCLAPHPALRISPSSVLPTNRFISVLFRCCLCSSGPLLVSLRSQPSDDLPPFCSIPQNRSSAIRHAGDHGFGPERHKRGGNPDTEW